MVIYNLSTRAIVLRDSLGNIYNCPALVNTTLATTLMTDDTFRQWVRYRVRDIVIDFQD